ncbi:PAAR domain-containing protein [Runella sp.]|uniref:PAAR domain-containing protein n=1 Tax=Runella sp. TaxID=1960881 RepID=UPI003D0EB478
MGQPAARVGDPAGHGGTLGPMGATTVKIGGMLAVRVGDPLICPGFDGPKPHIMGNVMKASMTVKINGAFAARENDPTGCGVAGVSGVGMPAVTGPPAPGVPGSFDKKGAVVGDGDAGFLWGQVSGYSNKDGAQGIAKGSGEHIEGKTTVGGATVAGSADGLTGTVEGHIGKGSIGASAQGSVVTAQGSVTDAQGNKVGGQGGLFNAQAGGDILLGTDGRRTGVGIGGSLQASVAEGQMDSTGVYNIPFTDYTFNVGSTLGGSVGSVGAAANAGAYHDAADDRYHLAGMIDIEAVIGAKLGLDLSIGKKAAPSGGGGGGGGTPGVGVPLTPGTIIKGFPTVLIGG